jgi:hypothetical protein
MRTSGSGRRIPRAQGKRQGYLLLCFFFNSECSILLTPSMAFLSMGGVQSSLAAAGWRHYARKRLLGRGTLETLQIEQKPSLASEELLKIATTRQGRSDR